MLAYSICTLVFRVIWPYSYCTTFLLYSKSHCSYDVPGGCSQSPTCFVWPCSTVVSNIYQRLENVMWLFNFVSIDMNTSSSAFSQKQVYQAAWSPFKSPVIETPERSFQDRRKEADRLLKDELLGAKIPMELVDFYPTALVIFGGKCNVNVTVYHHSIGFLWHKDYRDGRWWQGPQLVVRFSIKRCFCFWVSVTC